MKKGGKKVDSQDKLYICHVCGMVFHFDTGYENRGFIHQLSGKRAVKCFNPSCENVIEE